MSTMPRVNRPGPRRRCSPCPACGEDAMRQYGAKHHGLVTRYFYACQACQHTDVWREVQGGTAPHWERLRTPLVPPRPEQCRLELRKEAPLSASRQAQERIPVKNNFSLLDRKNVTALASAGTAFEDAPRTCCTCARYFAEEEVCSVPQELLREIALASGMVIAATELAVDAHKVRDCTHWVSETECDRFRLLRERLAEARQQNQG